MTVKIFNIGTVKMFTLTEFLLLLPVYVEPLAVEIEMPTLRCYHLLSGNIHQKIKSAKDETLIDLREVRLVVKTDDTTLDPSTPDSHHTG